MILSKAIWHHMKENFYDAIQKFFPVIMYLVLTQFAINVSFLSHYETVNINDMLHSSILYIFINLFLRLCAFITMLKISRYLITRDNPQIWFIFPEITKREANALLQSLVLIILSFILLTATSMIMALIFMTFYDLNSSNFIIGICTALLMIIISLTIIPYFMLIMLAMDKGSKKNKFSLVFIAAEICLHNKMKTFKWILSSIILALLFFVIDVLNQYIMSEFMVLYQFTSSFIHYIAGLASWVLSVSIYSDFKDELYKRV